MTSSEPSCTVDGCDDAVFARGLCSKHYSRDRRGKKIESSPQRGEPAGFGLYGVLERDEDTITCHACGAKVAHIGAHLTRAHAGVSIRDYRQTYGLPRTIGLVSLGLARTMSENAAARVGSPAWRRLESARDPQRAADSRTFDSAAATLHGSELGAELSAAKRGTGRERKCPVCGTPYRGRARTCSPECASTRSLQAAKAPTKGEVSAEDAQMLREATDPTPIVRKLQRQGVASWKIGRALGVSPATMTKRWPLPKR